MKDYFYCLLCESLKGAARMLVMLPAITVAAIVGVTWANFIEENFPNVYDFLFS